MGTPTKQDIIDVIRSTAKENSGNPLGQARFERETGISSYEWGRYWARFGDAQKEAGFSPNQLQGPYDDDFLIQKWIGLARKLGKFPTLREITVAKHIEVDFPSRKAFARLGTKERLAKKIKEYCEARDGYDDVVILCRSILERVGEKPDSDNSTSSQILGEVYLFKSGRYYKIGKTNDTVRRGRELRIQLPDACDLIHSIKTDDPSGVETYWHRRFEAKRKQGEWFDLSRADVQAFKHWKRIA